MGYSQVKRSGFFSKNPYLPTILSQLSNIIICLDPKGKIVEFNPAAECYFDCSRAEALGNYFIAFAKSNNFEFPPLATPSQENVQAFAQSMILESGEQRHALWKVIPLYDLNNRYRALALIGTDITSKRAAESGVRNIERHLESVIESIAGNHWWKDINGRYMGFNGALAKALGLKSADDILGKTDYELPWAGAADLLTRNDKSVIASGLPKTYEEQVPVIDGRILTFLVTKVPLKDEKGNIIGTIGTSFDITEQKNAQAQLKIAKEKAESANLAKSEFIANISHDLRTPLAGILGISEILGARVPLKDKELAQEIIRASKALLNVFNEIIEYIKIEAGNHPLQDNQLRIRDIVNDIVDLMKPSAVQKKLKLKIMFDDLIPQHLVGDASRVHRILLNLVSNAIKFTLKGSVAINVMLTKEEDKKVLLKIEVIDTGIGMPSDQLDQIFTRFTRLNSAYEGVFAGAGLGLSIVKQFVKEMEGQIYVGSELTKGSRFTCILPFKKSLLNEDIIKTEKSRRVSLKQNRIKKPNKTAARKFSPALLGNKPTPSILLIEDDLLAQKVAKLNLEELKCKVEIASSGKQGIEIFKQKNYDLVLLDIGLPDMSGYEVAKAIRKHEAKANHRTPIIVVTAHADTQDKQQCVEAEIDEVLIKPLMLEIVRDILEIHFKTEEIQDAIAHASQDESPRHHNIIDLDLGAKLVGGSHKSAKEMLKMLVEQLPNDKRTIETAYQEHDYQRLAHLVHKLHGGTCYCGTPKLREASGNLEQIIKSGKKHAIKMSYESLIEQVAAVLDAYKELE